MRKISMLAILSLVPAAGCQDGFESLRRVEVWKQHTFYSYDEPQLMAPVGPAGCDCNPPGIMPTTVSAGLPLQPAQPVSTEEFNGVLKQP